MQRRLAMSKKKLKREFSPNAHASIYLIAIVYLGYLLFQLIQSAVSGGPGAPSTMNLILGVVVLGGGILLLAFLSWKITHLPPADSSSDKSSDSHPAAKTDSIPENNPPD